MIVVLKPLKTSYPHPNYLLTPFDGSYGAVDVRKGIYPQTRMEKIREMRLLAANPRAGREPYRHTNRYGMCTHYRSGTPSVILSVSPRSIYR